MNNVATVYSSHGEIDISNKGGGVLEVRAMDDGEHDLFDIERFDTEEWRRFWEYGENMVLPDCYDILDLGYWIKDGKYEPPVKEHRERIKEGNNALIASKVDSGSDVPDSIAISHDKVRRVLMNIIMDSEDTDQMASLCEDITGARVEWHDSCQVYVITEGPDYCGAFRDYGLR